MANPGMMPEIALWDVDQLTPYERNPRNNEAAINAVAASIKNFGFLVPMVVDKDGVVVAGHTRLAAVRKLMEEDPANASFYRQVPVMKANDLTPDQVKAFRLIDNKTAEMATWDFDMLAREVAELQDTGVELIGFGQDEIDCMIALASAEADIGDNLAQDLMGGNEIPEDGSSRTNSAEGSIKITFGELSFYILEVDYREWMDALMKAEEFDKDTVVDKIAKRMGLLDQRRTRENALKGEEIRTEATEAMEEVAPMPRQRVPRIEVAN